MITSTALSGVCPLCCALDPMFYIPFNPHNNPRRDEFHSHFMDKKTEFREVKELVGIWELDIR